MSAEADQSTAATSVTVRFLDLAKSNPLFYFGVLFIGLAFYRPSGETVLERTEPTAWPLFVVGCVMGIVGSTMVLRSARRQASDRFTDTAAYDPVFWHRVFDAFPPAFIKAVEVGEDGKLAGEPKHIAENKPFDVFQDSEHAGDPTDEQRKVIKEDHERADRAAVEHGRSCQLESSDTYGLNSSQQIVTFKKRVEHGGRVFIVGWYMPVELTKKTPADGDEVEVRRLGGQAVFRFTRRRYDDEPTMRIRVGESARRAATDSGQPPAGVAPGA